MLTFDQAGDLLDTLAERFPPAFYRDLNGGISLLPDVKWDPAFQPGEMYVCGEYCRNQLGRYINLYYGSLAALARRDGWPDARWEEELYAVLAHEFTHHMEGLAGERGLERKDEAHLAQYRAGRDRR